MNILRDYPSLIALADELHFARAAERLGISQPQLSGIVKRLETRAGVKIFERRPAVRLTPAGEALVASARRSLTEAAQGLEIARAVAGGNAGSVRFGFAPISMLTGLGSVLQQFMADHPLVRLTLTEQHSASLAGDLEQGKLDLIIGRERPIVPRLKSIEIHREPMMLALPEAHPFAESEGVHISALAAQPLLMWSREAAPDYFDELQRGFAQAAIRPHIVHAVNGWSSLLALAAAGFGAAIVSKSVSTIQFPGIVYRQLDDFSAAAAFWLTWSPAKISPAAERLRARISDHFRASL